MRTHNTIKQIGDGYQVTIDNGVIDVESTGYLQLKALGQLGLTVTGSGHVAIGHTNPEKNFHVKGPGSVRIDMNSTTPGGATDLVLGAGQSGDHAARISLVGDTTNEDYAFRISRNATGINTISKLSHRGTGDLVIEAVDAAMITFETSNSERMVIDSDGLIGLGRDPSSALDIASGGEIWLRSGDEASVRLELGAGATAADGSIVNAEGEGDFADLHFANNGTNHALLDNNGNFGIGTTFTGSATNKLDVEGNASIGSGYIADAAPSNGLIVQGAVGIGNNNPSVTLDVSGSIKFDGYLLNDALGAESPVYQNIFGAQLADGSGNAMTYHSTRGYIEAASQVDWYIPIILPTGCTLKRVNVRMNKSTTSMTLIKLMLRHNRIGIISTTPATIGTTSSTTTGDQLIAIEADTPTQEMIDHNDDKQYFIFIDNGSSVNIVNAIWADVEYTRVIRTMR